MRSSILVQHAYKKYSRNSDGHLNYGIQDLWRIIRGGGPNLTLRKDEFFAVEDVSLDVQPGETLALVGRNGSGKTTLLKMLNGLTRPDSGTIVINGRVQALINLGAGFNQYLSGLDNIMNSAALMGLSRKKSLDIVDQVVEFSELDEFIDSPINTYSSGMKARLGFAVAVHLRPEILLIDEVLAVGDYAFQNKCFARLEQLKSEGVTIVFVSHNHNQVVKLCERAIWLHKGRVRHSGNSLETVQHYLNFLDEQDSKQTVARDGVRRQSTAQPVSGNGAKTKDGLYGPTYPGDTHVDEVLCRITVNGEEVNVIPIHSTVNIHFSFRLKHRVDELCSTLAFYRKDGMRVAAIATLRDGRLKHIHEGRVHCDVTIPDLDFVPGPYVIMMPISDGQEYLWRDVVKEFHIVGGGEIYVGVKDIKHDYKVYVE